MRAACAALLALVATPLAARAEERGREPGASMQYLLGKWTCEGAITEAVGGAKGATTSTMSFGSDMDGLWTNLALDVTFTETRRRMLLSLRGVIGDDPSGKQLVRTDWDSHGSYAQLTSSGWSGDKLVFAGEGVALGQRANLRRTMTRKSEGAMTLLFERAGADGVWISTGEHVCKRPREH